MRDILGLEAFILWDLIHIRKMKPEHKENLIKFYKITGLERLREHLKENNPEASKEEIEQYLNEQEKNFKFEERVEYEPIFPKNCTFYGFQYADLLNTSDEILIMGEFLKEGIFQKIEVSLQEYDEKKDETYEIEKISYTREKYLEEESKNFIFFWCTPYRLNQVFLYSFSAEIVREKANQYIQDCLHNWKKNEIKKSYNTFKAEKQLLDVVKDIFELLKNYDDKELLVELFQKKEIDSFASLLFLETIGCIEILDDQFTNGIPWKAHLKIDILPKFYTDFRMRQDETIEFDFENLLTLEEQEKRIRFEGPKTLKYKETLYILKEKTFPYIFINSLSKDQRTTFERLFEAFGEVGIPKTKESLRKDMKNFRGKLREKFNFPSEELFFEIQGEEIILTKDLFSL